MQPNNNQSNEAKSLKLKEEIKDDCHAVNDIFIEMSGNNSNHDYSAIIYHDKAVISCTSGSDEETFAIAAMVEKTALPTLKVISGKIKRILGADSQFVVVIDSNGTGLYGTKSGKPFEMQNALEAHKESYNRKVESADAAKQVVEAMLKIFPENSPFGKKLREKIAALESEECNCEKCQAEAKAKAPTQLATDRIKPTGYHFPN